MAIQFQCAACSEPIEIDSEWGGKMVACPYCRKTITAPAESTYFPPARVPAARPLTPSAARFEAVSDAEAAPYSQRPSASNSVAIWAMALTLACLVFVFVAFGLFAAHFSEIEPFVDMQMRGQSMTEVNQAIMDRFQGVFPGWMVAMAACLMLAGCLWLAGLICGLVAVRHPHRRRLAITSVVLSLAMAFFILVAPRS